MRGKTLLLLAVVVAGLAAFIAFVERDLPSTDERTERAKRLLDLEREEIDRIEIDSRSGRLVLDASGGSEGTEDAGTGSRWTIVEPALGAADQALVDGLLGELIALEAIRRIEDAEPGAVGLDAPRGRLVLVADDRRIEIAVGAEVPASSTMVVATAEGRAGAHEPGAHEPGTDEPGTDGPDAVVSVVEGGLAQTIDRPPLEWRSRELLTAPRSAIESLEISHLGSEAVRLERDGESFRITEPIADLADADHLSALLSALTGLEVATFIDTDEEESESRGLAEPWARVNAAISGSDEPFHLTLGALTETGDERYYRRGDGQVFLAPTRLDLAIARSADEWRSRRWTELESYQVDSLRVVGPSTGGSIVETVVEKIDGDWHRDGAAIAYDATGDFLYSLTGARAEGFVDSGVSTAEAELTVELTAGDRSERLELNAGADGWLGKSSERGVLLRLPTSLADELRTRLEALRTAELEGDGEESIEPLDP